MDPGTSRRSLRDGFTLAEMMVVVVIIGLLTTLVTASVLDKYRQAALTAARTDLAALTSALNEYAIRNAGRFPESLDVLVTPDAAGYTYLDQRKLPIDPWKNAYVYEPPVAGEPRPHVVSWGPDGQPGSADDLDNWEPRER